MPKSRVGRPSGYGTIFLSDMDCHAVSVLPHVHCSTFGCRYTNVHLLTGTHLLTDEVLFLLALLFSVM